MFSDTFALLCVVSQSLESLSHRISVVLGVTGVAGVAGAAGVTGVSGVAQVSLESPELSEPPESPVSCEGVAGVTVQALATGKWLVGQTKSGSTISPKPDCFFVGPQPRDA